MKYRIKSTSGKTRVISTFFSPKNMSTWKREYNKGTGVGSKMKRYYGNKIVSITPIRKK
jgi:hypothetical protein